MFKSWHSPAGLWFSVLGFLLVTQHGAVLEWEDCADSTHWLSCKSLFYSPCNDPLAGSLHSVALQIEPAASGSRNGAGGGAPLGCRRCWETGKHTHTQAVMFASIKMHAFSHPIYHDPDFLCKGHRKHRRGVFLPRSKLARSSCAQWYAIKDVFSCKPWLPW